MTPVSPTLAIFGCTTYKDTFAQHGLLHSDLPNAEWVDLLNAQVCRVAYQAVVAQSPGHEEIIAKYAGISPIHEASSVPRGAGIATIHRQVVGPRTPKPKWRDNDS